jgi:hypothetical protein
MFVFDNYPKLRDNDINKCANSASALAITDVMETYYKKRQYYEMMPYVNTFTTEMATYDYNQKINYVKFPEYYSKMKKKSDDMTLMGMLTKKLKKK